MDSNVPALERTRLALQEAVPGIPLFLRRPLRKEDIAGLMPLAGFLGTAVKESNLVSSGAAVALGPRENGGVEGDFVVCNNDYSLTYIEHGPSPGKYISCCMESNPFRLD